MLLFTTLERPNVSVVGGRFGIRRVGYWAGVSITRKIEYSNGNFNHIGGFDRIFFEEGASIAED